MTQSGQGEPAREGIVLPSDGGEPLLPGMTGGSAPQPTRPQPSGPGQPSGPQPSGPQSAAPPGGQAWGQPWGPEQQSAAAPQPDQGWPPAPALEWGTTNQPTPWTPQVQHGPGAGPLPPEGSPTPPHGGAAPQDPAAGAYGSGATGAAQLPYGSGGDAAQLPYGDGGAQQQSYGGGGAQQQSYGGGGAQQQSYGAPLPPAAPAEQAATQYIPPSAPAEQAATQYIPPVAPADQAATQYIPPVAAGGPGPVPAPAGEGATQYIPPVAPGPLPPEASGQDARFLGRAEQPQPAAPGSDAEATQYIPPVAAPYGGEQGGDRQPPAEFDNLFRSAAGGPAAAPPTQQMPPFQQPQSTYPGQPQPAYTPQGPGGGGGRRGAQDGGGRGGRRGGSRVPLIAAAGVGIIVLGVGAGALLSSGGGDDKGDNKKTVAASAPADSGSPSAADDPAQPQAAGLDKLLADSGGSRASVIKAVADVKACRNQGEAAAALRAAAKQRTDLVSRLSQLAVDQLPDHAELTTALTKAWQASASADNHYAAWADQAAKKNGCKKGQARTTGQAQEANRDSGTASTEKSKAARLWNAIAKKYGLTERQATQL
ncbi:hypothetical protein ACJ6WF_18145 [Streptomyces sp. MMS24-I2-30]|uniref:hypothetical protein n=1 Tax=Streptomyces sp. MMS24-I2-30 TaxID=3351564 RepID=UPI0038969FDE